MGKGSKRRPQEISDAEMGENWARIFGKKKSNSGRLMVGEDRDSQRPERQKRDSKTSGDARDRT